MDDNEIGIDFVVTVDWMYDEIIWVRVDDGKWKIGQGWLKIR